MNNMLKRIRNRKGFTLMELIVVILIIAVLLVMILPGLFSSDKPTKAKGYAKSYFYTVQDFASKQKIAEDKTNPLFTTGSPDLYLYTTVDKFGDVVESGIVASDLSDMTDSVTYSGGSADQKLKDFVTKFARDMESNVTSSEYAGTFYAVVDTNYVVKAAYWSDGLISELKVGNPTLLFESDNQVSGYVCCAYPVDYSKNYSDNNRSMFKYTY